MSDISRHYADEKLAEGEVLHRSNTFVSLSPEQFEKLYLSPQNKTAGALRNTFGNPTPIAILGFVVALLPLAIEFMGWRGSAGNSATVGANIFFGGMLLIMAAIGEFLLGNTFPCAVFMGYGAHFLTFSVTFIPWFGAVSSYNLTGPTAGTETLNVPFMASFGFYCVSMTMLSFIFLVCSLRTNIVFVLVFTTATIGFGLAAGAFWNFAEGAMAVGTKCLVGAGGSFFACAMFGWYLLFAIMMTTVDMPFAVPVGDLSTVIKGMSQKTKAH